MSMENRLDVHMSLDELQMFQKYIKKSNFYLEFGSGGSTFEVLLTSDATVFSVESDEIWIKNLNNYEIINKSQNDRLFLYHIDIGPTGSWGHPINPLKKHLFPNYSHDVFDLIPKEQIDTVLIDGRFRVACTVQTMLNCNENTTIIIHDFWDREDYHEVCDYLDVIERVDTLAVFKVKKDVDKDKILELYEKYKYVTH